MTKIYLLELLDTSIYEAGYDVQTVGVFFDLEVARRAESAFWHLINRNTINAGTGYRSPVEHRLKIRIREVEEARIIYFDKDPDEETFGR